VGREMGFAYLFLSDTNADVIWRYDLLHVSGVRETATSLSRLNS
jgi:hypothetical protein